MRRDEPETDTGEILPTMKKKMFAGVDIGGTKIFAGLVDESGRVVARQKTPTPPKATSKAVVATICDTIDEILKRNDVTSGDLGGIGLGLPGSSTRIRAGSPAHRT